MLPKQCFPKAETESIFKKGLSFLVRRYSFEDLITRKINLVLARVWPKGKEDEIKAKERILSLFEKELPFCFNHNKKK